LKGVLITFRKVDELLEEYKVEKLMRRESK